MRDLYRTPQNSDERRKRACAIPAKCQTIRSGADLDGDWEEFVIRRDPKSGKYVTRTACCAGAKICC